MKDVGYPAQAGERNTMEKCIVKLLAFLLIFGVMGCTSPQEGTTASTETESDGTDAGTESSSDGSTLPTTAGPTTDETTAGPTTEGETETQSTSSGTDSETETTSEPTTDTETDSDTTGPTSDTDTTETDTGPLCEPGKALCEELAAQFGWDPERCAAFGRDPLTNAQVAALGMGQSAAARYQQCPGETAVEKLPLLLEEWEGRDEWLALDPNEEADKCQSAEMLEYLQSLQGIFAYPSGMQMPKNLSKNATNQAVLTVGICGTDDMHKVESISVARMPGNGACTDDLTEGDGGLDAVLEVQLLALAPYAAFDGQTGVADVVPNDPLYTMNDQALDLTLRVNVGLSGEFCIVPIDDGILQYVSSMPAPDHTVLP